MLSGSTGWLPLESLLKIISIVLCGRVFLSVYHLLMCGNNYYLFAGEISCFFSILQTMFWKILYTIMICSMRTVLVLVSWGVAISIPRFELCLAFVGSLATSILAFVLPPLFHLKLKWYQVPMWRNVLHITILVLGVAATIIATTVNLYMAVTSHSSTQSCTAIQDSCNA